MAAEKLIDYHLSQAMNHLKTAIELSVEGVIHKKWSQREVGLQWEHFLGDFFGCIRDQSRQYRVNLLGWINFPRFR